MEIRIARTVRTSTTRGGGERNASRGQSGGRSVVALSPRLRQTLTRLLEGKREKEVAGELGLSPTTVHGYVRALYRHFGVSSRAELSAHFLGLGGGEAGAAAMGGFAGVGPAGAIVR
jgi:DNA-binding NarL/FixJ family response regulator